MNLLISRMRYRMSNWIQILQVIFIGMTENSHAFRFNTALYARFSADGGQF